MTFNQRARFTPSEMRAASIFASITYEEKRCRYSEFFDKEIEEDLQKIHNTIETKYKKDNV